MDCQRSLAIKNTMANCHASKVGGKLEFDSRPWCSRHTEEFCNQGKCAACVNENFWSFFSSTDRPKTNLVYLWVTQLTFSDSTKLNKAENWRGTMSCSIALTAYFFAATGNRFISVNSSGLPLLGHVPCAGGVPISSPCPVWEWSYSSALFLKLWCLFLLLPLSFWKHSFVVGNNSVPHTTSGKILIPHNNATILSLRHTLGEKIDNARYKQKKPIWPIGLAETSTVLFPNFDHQLCNWSTIKLPRNAAKRKCKLLKSCQAQMRAPRPGERVVQDNALKPQDRLWLKCLNYHNRVFLFSNEIGVFCQCHEKVWEIKKIDERFVISHQKK